MKKKFLIPIIILLSIVTLLFLTRDRSLDEKSGGEYLTSSTSPKGSYTVEFYIFRGGALNADCVLGKLIHNGTGQEKNIYWQYRDISTFTDWIDEHTATINGVTLDVRYDVYDSTVHDVKNTDDISPIDFWKSIIFEYFLPKQKTPSSFRKME